jgi:hypothetical protein
MPLVDSSFLSDLEEIRGIGAELGLRPYTVTAVVHTWSGSRIGLGIKTTTKTQITNGTDPYTGLPVTIGVRQVSRKEIVASGGAYTDRDLRVGPMTPAFAATLAGFAGGFTDSTLDPTPTGTPTEVHYLVTGPSVPAGGAAFDKIGEEATALHYFVIIRQTGRVPPT